MLFKDPLRQTIITTVNFDGTADTITAPELIFPNPTGVDFFFLIITSMLILAICFALNGSPAENLPEYDNKPSTHATVSRSPYSELIVFNDSPALQQSMHNKSKSSSSEKTSTKKTGSKKASKKNGLLFADANTTALTEKQISKMLNAHSDEASTDALIDRAIKEIYAAAGEAFLSEPELHDYFMNFSWYKKLDHHTIDFEDLSPIEQQNINMLENFL